MNKRLFSFSLFLANHSDAFLLGQSSFEEPKSFPKGGGGHPEGISGNGYCFLTRITSGAMVVTDHPNS